MKWIVILILLLIPSQIESEQCVPENDLLTKVYESENIVIYHHVNTINLTKKQVMKKGLYKLLY